VESCGEDVGQLRFLLFEPLQDLLQAEEFLRRGWAHEPLRLLDALTYARKPIGDIRVATVLGHWLAPFASRMASRLKTCVMNKNHDGGMRGGVLGIDPGSSDAGDYKDSVTGRNR
jgi:hypothetical protein